MILDSDTVHRVFPEPTADYQPIFDAISTKTIQLVYGGDLTAEYQRISYFWRILRRLDQAGSAHQESTGPIVADAAVIRATGFCTSNDFHILALARIGKARLLCTQDNNLMQDFTNHRIIANPRGNIYRTANHAHLINRHCRRRQ